MNIIIIIMLAIVALFCAAMFLTWTFQPREEVHNSETPDGNQGKESEGQESKAPAETPKPDLQEKAPKPKPQAEAPKPKPQAKAPKPSDPEEIPEEEIRTKMRAGLTREQAVEVILNQRDHDAALAKAAKESK